METTAALHKITKICVGWFLSWYHQYSISSCHKGLSKYKHYECLQTKYSLEHNIFPHWGICSYKHIPDKKTRICLTRIWLRRRGSSSGKKRKGYLCLRILDTCLHFLIRDNSNMAGTLLCNQKDLLKGGKCRRIWACSKESYPSATRTCRCIQSQQLVSVSIHRIEASVVLDHGITWDWTLTRMVSLRHSLLWCVQPRVQSRDRPSFERTNKSSFLRSAKFPRRESKSISIYSTVLDFPLKLVDFCAWKNVKLRRREKRKLKFCFSLQLAFVWFDMKYLFPVKRQRLSSIPRFFLYIGKIEMQTVFSPIYLVDVRKAKYLAIMRSGASLFSRTRSSLVAI